LTSQSGDQVKGLEGQLEAKDSEIFGLKTKITELEVAVNDRDEKINKLTAAGDLCNKDKDDLKEKITELKEDKISLSVRIAELEKQLNSEHARLDAQTADVDSKIAELNL